MPRILTFFPSRILRIRVGDQLSFNQAAAERLEGRAKLVVMDQMGTILRLVPQFIEFVFGVMGDATLIPS